MPASKVEPGKPYFCSFCGKGRTEVKTLIAGPAVNICDACVNVCRNVIDRANGPKADTFIPTGMTLAQFEIGGEFLTVLGRWICTDKGTRTIIAKRVARYDGLPPPLVIAEVETIFDKDNFAGCSPAGTPAGSEGRPSVQFKLPARGRRKTRLQS